MTRLYIPLTTIAFLLAVAPANAADDAMTAAAGMVATTIVYATECKPNDEMKKKLVSVSKLFMDAAGVDFSNRQFLAMTTIKANEYALVAKDEIQFCKLMLDAFQGH